MDTEPLGTISVEEILQALDSGEIIEEYPEDKPYPSCLILGREEAIMQCVICKSGEVQPATVEAELKVEGDRLLVPVEAEACVECGEAYYSTETMRYLEGVK